jgi:hypothetical protein
MGRIFEKLPKKGNLFLEFTQKTARSQRNHNQIDINTISTKSSPHFPPSKCLTKQRKPEVFRSFLCLNVPDTENVMGLNDELCCIHIPMGL